MFTHSAARERFTFLATKGTLPSPFRNRGSTSPERGAAGRRVVSVKLGDFALKWTRNSHINVPECRRWEVKLRYQTAETLQQHVCLSYTSAWGAVYQKEREWVS